MNNHDEQSKPETVNAEALADLLGISKSKVGELAREGLLKRVSPGRFNRRDAVRAYCERLRQMSRRGTTDPELAEEKKRLAREQADKVALQNAASRRELLPAKGVEAEWASILRDVRAGVLAAPSRIGARLPHLSPHDASVIDDELRSALTELTELSADANGSTSA